MELLSSQTDAVSLTRLCEEALSHLFAGNYRFLTDTYYYAVANDRDPAQACQEDLSRSLCSGDRLLGSSHVQVEVRYFEPNDIPLFASVSCHLGTHFGGSVLAEFVVIGKERKCLSLEQVSGELDDAI